MKKVSLSTKTFDLAGSVMLDNVEDRSSLRKIKRRAVRTATLDGGAYINDSGFADADRTLEIAFRPRSLAQFDSLVYLVENYSDLTVVIEDGAYSGVISDLIPGTEFTTVKILVSATA